GRGRLPHGHDRPRRRGRLPGGGQGRRPGPPRGAARPLRRLPRPGHRLRARGGRARRARRRRPVRPGRSRRHRRSVRVSLQGVERSAIACVRRGPSLTREFRGCLLGTRAPAVVATAGKVIVPIAVQQTIDVGLGGPRPDVGYTRSAVIACAVAVLVTAFASYWMNVRLYKATEASLATLRERGFRHVHDLSVLTQNAERRGALVSRVTTDVDQIPTFMQSGGLTIIVSTGQVLVASALMLFYSWQLTLLAWACFVPLAFALPRFQRWLSAAYTQVRQRTGDVLAAVSEAVVGAAVIRAYGAEDRTAERLDAAI